MSWKKNFKIAKKPKDEKQRLKDIAKAIKEIDKIRKKKNTCQENLEQLTKRLVYIEELITLGRLSEDEAEDFIDQVESDIDENGEKIDFLGNEEEAYQEIMLELTDKVY